MSIDEQKTMSAAEAIDRYAALRADAEKTGDPELIRGVAEIRDGLIKAIATPPPGPAPLTPMQATWAAWRAREDAVQASGFGGLGFHPRDPNPAPVVVDGLAGDEIMRRYRATLPVPAKPTPRPTYATPAEEFAANLKAEAEWRRQGSKGLGGLGF